MNVTFYKFIKESKQIIKKWLLPPGVTECIQAARRMDASSVTPLRIKTEYEGAYASWQDALNNAEGYDDPLIFHRTLEAERLVRDGKIPFQRDGYIFEDGIHYTWPLLANLMFVLARQGRLNLLDLGGSLGCIYRQSRYYLDKFTDVRWNVTDQRHFVEAGRAEFEDGRLFFYDSTDECFAHTTPDTLLLGSVLPYIDNPYPFLEQLLEKRFSHILLDRTPFSRDGEHRITVQHLPDYLYTASYPCHVLSKRKIYDILLRKYSLLEEYDVETDNEDNAQPLILGSLWILNP